MAIKICLLYLLSLKRHLCSFKHEGWVKNKTKIVKKHKILLASYLRWLWLLWKQFIMLCGFIKRLQAERRNTKIKKSRKSDRLPSKEVLVKLLSPFMKMYTDSRTFCWLKWQTDRRGNMQRGMQINRKTSQVDMQMLCACRQQLLARCSDSQTAWLKNTVRHIDRQFDINADSRCC